MFFLLGLAAGLFRTELRLPEAIYELLSIYLLLAIGLKGGRQLALQGAGEVGLPVLAALALGIAIPLIAYVILRRLGRFSGDDAAAIAAHYGSVSAVTFAVVLAFLDRLAVAYEPLVAVLLVVMEVPAIGVAIALVRLTARGAPGATGVDWAELGREVFLNKSIYLLLGGLAIGWVADPAKLAPFDPLFVNLFKGLLAFFLLELGIIVSRRLADLRQVGAFLGAFALVMPLVSATLGLLAAHAVGLSVGGATVLATLAASASYIAAPAAVRIAIPNANPTYYLTAALGVTFPFNVVFGIPLYWAMAQRLYG
jgi:hypothetical protein